MFSGFSGLYLLASSLGTVTIKNISIHIQILTWKSTSHQWIPSQLDGGKETKPTAWPNSDTLFIKFNISGKHHLLRCHNIEKLNITLLKKVDYFQRRGAIPGLDIALHEVRRPSTPFSTWLITFQWWIRRNCSWVPSSFINWSHVLLYCAEGWGRWSWHRGILLQLSVIVKRVDK